MRLPRQRHLVNSPMAGRTANSLLHVDAVIEKYEVRQIIDPVPLQGAVKREALSDRGEHRSVRPDLRMAAHANLRCRNSGKRRSLDAGVAIAAIDSESRVMMLMAERHELPSGDVSVGRIRRPKEIGRAH